MKRTLTAICAVATLLLHSCGSSNTQLGGIQGSGTGVAYGPITGFGSIFVNGVEFTTSSAQITIDDRAGSESSLQVGDVVTVTGTVNADGKTGTASQVTFNGDVTGPVAQIDSAGGSFIVLGQTVRVTGSTMFDENMHPASIAGLQLGTVVEVSGFADAAAEILASRIQLASSGTSLEAKGSVQSLDTAVQTFQLNTLVVDYSNVMPSGTLTNGVSVKVTGGGFTTSGALLATSVQVLRGFVAASNSQAQVEGLITSFTSNTDFVLDGQHVTTNANTIFTLNGVTLGMNVRVEVEGSFDSSGTLLATSVEARPDSSSMVRGLVESTPANNTLTVLGVTVAAGATTQLEDDSSMHLRHFKLSDLRSGDYVEARGSAGQNASLAAKVVWREIPASLSFLQGTATSVSFPTLTLLGVSVTTISTT
ncbi:MAG: hypothetical protein E6K52_11885, partial [Gammaproteobacteria bacterium]